MCVALCRNLWISWGDGVIKAGAGDAVGSGVLLNATDPHGVRLVERLGLGNYVPTSYVEWQFARSTGEFCTHTHAHTRTRTLISLKLYFFRCSNRKWILQCCAALFP